jgi:nitrogen fixation protein NifB
MTFLTATADTIISTAEVKRSFLKLSQLHPCFGAEAHNKFGRLHLPVSPACNIQCRFCKRSINEKEARPGVSAGILRPDQAVETVKKALALCPDITVVGIAGPGDTLATDAALNAFRAVHQAYPHLIKCISTNGLRLPDRAEELIGVGVKTVTVTVNAVDPYILDKVVSHIVFEGKKITGPDMGEILTAKQLEGIRRVSDLGATVKVNTVLVPGINDKHIEDIACAVSEAGAQIYNIIPLIPQHELAHIEEPDCDMLEKAREDGGKYLEVFRHCKHCRADACGIPGLSDFSRELYGGRMETFSHG